MAVSVFTAQRLSIFLGNGDGSFRMQQDLDVLGPGWAVTADFDNDGGTDIAVIAESTATLKVFLNTPVIGRDHNALDFGSLAVGTTSAVSAVVISNPGTSPLTIGNITLTGSNAGDFKYGTTCKQTLAANQYCFLGAIFSPQGPGPRHASFVITDNSPSSPQTITVGGTGVQ